MIQETKTHVCSRCGSQNIVKNGLTPYGKQQFKCNDCRRYSVLEPSEKYSSEEKERIMAAYQERPSMRGIERVFGVSRHTLSAWLKKSQRNAK